MLSLALLFLTVLKRTVMIDYSALAHQRSNMYMHI